MDIEHLAMKAIMLFIATAFGCATLALLALTVSIIKGLL